MSLQTSFVGYSYKTKKLGTLCKLKNFATSKPFYVDIKLFLFIRRKKNRWTFSRSAQLQYKQIKSFDVPRLNEVCPDNVKAEKSRLKIYCFQSPLSNVSDCLMLARLIVFQTNESHRWF